MATRGIKQLLRLRVYYCEHGGSSRTLRDFVAAGRLNDWASQNPEVNIELLVRNGKHPFIEGEYQTQTADHQVTVRNAPDFDDIDGVLNLLRNRSGRKLTKLTTPVLTDSPSVQGVWTPFLNLHLEQPFGVKIHNDGDPQPASG